METYIFYNSNGSIAFKTSNKSEATRFAELYNYERVEIK